MYPEKDMIAIEGSIDKFSVNWAIVDKHGTSELLMFVREFMITEEKEGVEC